MLEYEHPFLMQMPTAFDGYVETLCRVSSTCLVHVSGSHYSVPCEWVGQMVSARLYPQQLKIVAADDCVAIHERLTERGQTRYNWQHYIPLIQRKPAH